MAAKSKQGVHPEALPPTDGAAKQHSLRVFLQITYWKTFMETTL